MSRLPDNHSAIVATGRSKIFEFAGDFSLFFFCCLTLAIVLKQHVDLKDIGLNLYILPLNQFALNCLAEWLRLLFSF